MNDENILPVVNTTFMKEPKIHPSESLYNDTFKLSEERIEDIMWICLCCILPALLLLIFILLILKII